MESGGLFFSPRFSLSSHLGEGGILPSCTMCQHVELLNYPFNPILAGGVGLAEYNVNVLYFPANE